MFLIALLILGAYLLGSVPFGLLFSKALGKKDPRSWGSGNIGATNVFRTSGLGAAVLTLLADGLKGYVPAWGAVALQLGPWEAILVGLAAFLGHLFPVYLGFKGGKGVATAAGIMAALAPLVLFGCLGVFILGFALSRLVSVGSIMAAFGAPVGAKLLGGEAPLVFLTLVLACGILWRHKENMRRLLKGEEKPLIRKPRPG
ncbi:MAG: glycerol-3-phosphate 1-O-acyltransferase PlsY [bacterium]